MEEESNTAEISNQPENKLWIWVQTTVPSSVSFLILLLCLLVDSVIAYQLIRNHNLFNTGLLVIAFIYVPVVFTLILKCPDPPSNFSPESIAIWMLETLLVAALFPIIVSVRLLLQVIWSVMVILAKKPSQEILHEYDKYLSRETHTYLFLQAFLHSAPQAVLQLHLLFLSVSQNTFTEWMQCASVLLSTMSVAYTTSLYHRYQAQVEGGRSPVLLLNPPQINPSREPLVNVRLNSPHACLDMDTPLSKVVTFYAWFLLIFGRVACSVMSLEVHPQFTMIMLANHFAFVIIYFLTTQPTCLIDIPSRIISALFSTIALVEVSVRFHRIKLFYILYFMCVLTEDTFLLFFAFLYGDYKCSEGVLNCKYFSTYAYLILNAHVLGVLVFGLYLLRFQPKTKEINQNVPSLNQERHV